MVSELELGLSILCSRQAPMKLVPWSERICFAGPLMAKNLLRALMQLLELMASITSMCTALVHIHENMTAHLLMLACPPLVRREVTSHGSKTSTPT